MATRAANGRRTGAHFTGCLLGGAVGDALGAPVEFINSLAVIRQQFGPDGIRDLTTAYGVHGAITDDTQMTLFTAEGLLRAAAAGTWPDRDAANESVYRAYLRWLRTQSYRHRSPTLSSADGWLLGVPALHALREPGTTCMGSLGSGRMGTLVHRLNDSKGCGGVMRVAPVGLVAPEPFALGCATAAITHSHPSGYLSAGALAHILAALVAGASLPTAIDGALQVLRRHEGHGECSLAIERAVSLAGGARGIGEEMERLGAAWFGEEALAMSLFAALVAIRDPGPEGAFERGIVLAVNHAGDSDSTGAIAGNILGLLLGAEAIPRRWRDAVELRAEIESIALDLHACFVEGASPDPARYPPTDGPTARRPAG